MDFSEPLPDAGIKVPIYATFTGLKGVPLLALATNSYVPLLRLHEDRIDFKIIRSHSKTLDQIEYVSASSWRLAKNLEFAWKDTRFTLSANVIREDWLIQVLYFLRRKNVVLAPRAEAFIDKNRTV